VKRHRISIHDHDLSFVTAGEGPVLVLIHGMAGCSDSWKRVVPALARRFTLVVPDLLGHGASAKPMAEYSVSGHANVVRDLLAALGHERATLVGQSFGGGVAMQVAYQYPEHCERLVLVSSGGLGREVSTLLRALSLPGAEHVFPLFCSPVLRDAGRRVVEWLGGIGLRQAPAAEEAWRSYSSLAERDARRAFFRTLRAVIDAGGQSVSAMDRLYLASHVPTLILWGRKDALIPVSHAFAAHQAIAGSRLEVFDDVGHFPHCEAPERFVDVLLDFIETSEPACLSRELRSQLLRRIEPCETQQPAA
jgi:pimeloyl-ACP methyl ester carboxylesterase